VLLNGTWFTVRGSPSQAVADVACHQLGFVRSLLHHPQTFFANESSHQVQGVNCTGNEASVQACPQGAPVVNAGEVSLQCYGASGVAAVVCALLARLARGSQLFRDCKTPCSNQLLRTLITR
jgi:hypothetical protein